MVTDPETNVIFKDSLDAILSSQQLLIETAAQLQPYRPNAELMRLYQEGIKEQLLTQRASD